MLQKRRVVTEEHARITSSLILDVKNIFDKLRPQIR